MKISEYLDKASVELVAGAEKVTGNLSIDEGGRKQALLLSAARFTVQLDGDGNVAESQEQSVCQVKFSLYL